MHDWTRISAGDYHNFHQDWTIELKRTLNRGVLPEGYEAAAESKVFGSEPDVVTVQAPNSPPGGVAVADAPPRSVVTARAEPDALSYARRANRIVIRQVGGAVIAVIEVVSPGNKPSKAAVEQFRAVKFLERGVNVVVIDPFPPTRRDPGGLGRLVWDHVASEPLPLPPAPDGKPLSVTAFDATDGLTAYADPLAVGDELPEAALFLARGWYVKLPLEATYQRSWAELTPRVRALLG